ncbi:2,3-diaminopropionate biosynthesis protein SbnB [Actinoplanes sp. NPDC049668]|uniref:2,3-diaminopropionate biosynthesis protein SbnB n=1 Tax=unclassified Actinoplanes TaxID=2626549 RepID=UPI0033AD4F4A
MLIIGREQVRQALDGADAEVVAAVRAAYERHERGGTAVPHSVFLRFPDDDRNRIIALPAYLGGDDAVAGVKWISSFPGNVAAGHPRASAVMILNSMRTGVPEALLEAATISARRTAASAALAAATLAADVPDAGVTLVGCGVINGEVLRLLRTTLPELGAVTVFDLDRQRARAFAAECATRHPDLKVDVAPGIEAALGAHRLVSLATTASTPHLDDRHCRPGSLLLHLSLRDLTPQTVLTSTNIVDDADHVCRASTSLHLAEQEVGNREFIAASLGELLAGGVPYRRDETGLTVFSPFGLGILDLAVARLARRRAAALGVGTEFTDF